MISIVVLSSILLMVTADNSFNPPEPIHGNKCERIQGECMELGYLYTISSRANNTSLFSNQRAADEFIKSFQLIQSCSAYLNIFLCGIYKPSCHEEAALVVQPCKSMCFHVYEKCFPVLERLGIQWTDELNCESLLDDKTESCMKDPGYPKDSINTNGYFKQLNKLLGLYHKETMNNTETNIAYLKEKTLKDRKCYKSVNHTGIRMIKCPRLCHDQLFYTTNQKEFTLIFTVTLTLLCSLVSIITATGILIDKNARIKNSNQFLVLISIVCFCRSILLLISVKLTPTSDELFIFLLIDDYLDTVSFSIWLALVVWWVLIFQFKIKLQIVYLCLSAFALPFIKTSLVLVNQVGDVSHLTDQCIIGNSDKATLLAYKILPNLGQISLGLFCLIISFFKLACARSSRIQKKLDLYKNVSLTKIQMDRTDLNRIGISGLILSLPLIFIVTCQLLEFFETENIYKSVDLNLKNLTNQIKFHQEDFERFYTSLTKIFMSYLNGFLVFAMFLSTKSLKKINKNKPDEWAKDNIDTGSDNKEILNNDETMSHSVESGPYHNDEIYERSCQLAELPSERDIQGFNTNNRRLRPVSDHIYYQPNYSYYTSNQKLEGVLADAESLENWNITFPRMNTFNAKKHYNECSVLV